ncbi:uncharacterized protein TM35_000173240 [Trypanosoma theileri]|uniref:Uncharacterized protein n=1 Tax=Trypanosoma theileri TaxID=67003 RepID=A0A1X0NUU5_9TRYP|nr:uncharacterized protein TM35_000173240 [Trypanosoma theileri]ORC88452.1 hypothetical protein TM35_000173240 [Trypanosoma theileri]
MGVILTRTTELLTWIISLALVLSENECATINPLYSSLSFQLSSWFLLCITPKKGGMMFSLFIVAQADRKKRIVELLEYILIEWNETNLSFWEIQCNAISLCRGVLRLLLITTTKLEMNVSVVVKGKTFLLKEY